jgi:hypothetical protein
MYNCDDGQFRELTCVGVHFRPKTVSIKHSSNLGEQVDRSGGWACIMDGAGGILWLCTDCKRRAVQHLQEIQDVFSVPLKSFYLIGLEKFITKRTAP